MIKYRKSALVAALGLTTLALAGCGGGGSGGAGQVTPPPLQFSSSAPADIIHDANGPIGSVKDSEILPAATNIHVDIEDNLNHKLPFGKQYPSLNNDKVYLNINTVGVSDDNRGAAPVIVQRPISQYQQCFTQGAYACTTKANRDSVHGRCNITMPIVDTTTGGCNEIRTLTYTLSGSEESALTQSKIPVRGVESQKATGGYYGIELKFQTPASKTAQFNLGYTKEQLSNDYGLIASPLANQGRGTCTFNSNGDIELNAGTTCTVRFMKAPHLKGQKVKPNPISFTVQDLAGHKNKVVYTFPFTTH